MSSQASKHSGTRGAVLLLATVRLEEGPEMPCNVSQSIPGLLFWEDYCLEDAGRAKKAAEVQEHI